MTMMAHPIDYEEKLDQIREIFGSSRLDYGWLEKHLQYAAETGETGAIAGFVFRPTEHSVRIEVDPELFYFMVPKDLVKESSRFAIHWEDEYEDLHSQ